MDIRGKVIAVPNPVSGTSARGPWTRQTIVIEYESGQYPKSLAVTNMRDADTFGRIPVGSSGVFKVDFKASEYQGKWYNEVTCWGWSIDGAAPSAPSSSQVPPI